MAPTDRTAGSRKRKAPKDSGVLSSKRRIVADNEPADDMAQILELEDQVSQSRKHYNNIATLITMLNVDEPDQQPNMLAAVSLCRVFSRLIALGNLSDSSRAAENEKIIVAWLKERYQVYQKALLAILREADPSSQVGIPCSARASSLTGLGRCFDVMHASYKRARYTYSWCRYGSVVIWPVQRGF